MGRTKYNTRQQDELVEFFKNHGDGCYTAKDIIKSGEVSSGEATIYRTLSKLSEQGVLNRFTDGGASSYRLSESAACTTHFHLRCERCRALIHLDCEFMVRMTEHIAAHHGFEVDAGKTIIYGLCADCAAKERNNA